LREQDLIAFGKKLKKIRQEKELELKNIAEGTKINISYLKNFEEGNFNFLPALYVRSFLKLYLQQLGEDWSSFLSEYDAIKSEEIKSEATKSEEIKSNVIKTDAIKSEKKLMVRVVTDEDLKAIKKPDHLRKQIATILEKIKPYLRQMTILLFGLGAIIIFWAIYASIKKEENPPIISAGSTAESLVELQSNLPDTIATSPDTNKAITQRAELNLELKAIEKTWLQIVVDDSVAKELTFYRGTVESWRAKEKFKLRIGNAAGIRLFLNGRDLGKLGDPGEVVKFDLTEQGIQNSSL